MFLVDTLACSCSEVCIVLYQANNWSGECTRHLSYEVCQCRSMSDTDSITSLSFDTAGVMGFTTSDVAIFLETIAASDKQNEPGMTIFRGTT